MCQNMYCATSIVLTKHSQPTFHSNISIKITPLISDDIRSIVGRYPANHGHPYPLRPRLGEPVAYEGLIGGVAVLPDPPRIGELRILENFPRVEKFQRDVGVPASFDVQFSICVLDHAGYVQNAGDVVWKEIEFNWSLDGNWFIFYCVKCITFQTLLLKSKEYQFLSGVINTYSVIRYLILNLLLLSLCYNFFFCKFWFWRLIWFCHKSHKM